MWSSRSQVDVREGEFGQLGDRVAGAAAEDVVVGLILLEHQPGCLHDVAGERPVADGAQIAEDELSGQSELDRSRGARDLARDK